MKYVLVIGDGMADFPVGELGDKTPLEAARKPVIDGLAKRGRVGEVKTVPDGVPAGSDTAILSIFGYDPRRVYTGRSPLEAAGSGVKMKKGNVSFRCNLAAVTEAGEVYEEQTMLSHSGGAIDGEDAMALMNDLIQAPAFARRLRDCGMTFTVNPSYRHIAVMETGSDKVETTPPHDILTRPIAQYLPKGEGEEMLRGIMRASWEILKDHPINAARRAAGRMPANSLWFWGQGSAVELDSFAGKYGHGGDAITAVPLVAGIAELAGLKHTAVPGATGEIDTNYRGKVEAALAALARGDFAALHVEAPDECGHAGDAREKVRAIELLDREVFRPLLEGLDARKEDYRLLFLSDHYTPVRTRTHDGTPVPYLLYDSREDTGRGLGYCEASAALAGERMEEGTHLMPLLFERGGEK
jgi:2,3-bisphosphoglycerate-independent phosphoglycerate mutase